jgi:hypothetical protein
MRILALTILLALLAGAVAIGAWALFEANFSPPAASEAELNNTARCLTDYRSMAGYMPVPPKGWAVNNSTGGVYAETTDAFSFARTDYVRPGTGATASVVIYDSGGGNIVWDSIFNTGFVYDNEDGYAKVFAYKGMPAWETARYGPSGNAYSLYIKLDERYGVAVLLRNVTGESPVMGFADRINVYKIKTLKK